MLYLFLRFMIGSALFSFACCTADRSLRSESFVRGRSHCDSCGHVLSFRDMIPVLSWLLRKGRCRWCGARIPVHVFVWEAAGGILGVLILQYGEGVLFHRWMLFLYVSVLMIMSRIDRKTCRIPVFLQYWSAVPVVLDVLMVQDHPAESVCWVFVIAGLALINRIRPVMGNGDFKLLGIGALLLGKRIVPVFVLSMWTGIPVILIRRFRGIRSGRLPYVPLYTCGLLVVMFGLDQILFALVT